MLGKLICGLPKWMGGGHKRGKRVGTINNPSGPNFADFQCPRCGAMWARKVKVKS